MNHLDKDVAVCQKAVLLNPRVAEAHYDLGMAYLSLGRREEAVSSFKHAVALKSDFAEACYQLGYMYSLLGNYNGAIACGRRAVDLNPNYAEAYNNIGYSYLSLGDLNAAVTHFRRAVAAKPEYVRANFNLGLSLLNQGQSAIALAALQKAVQLQRDFAEAFSHLGLAYLNGERPQEAVEYLRQAVALKPDQSEIHYNLGYALNRLEDSEAAAACYEKVLALRPDFFEGHFELGTIYGNLGRYEQAMIAFKNAIRLKPDNVEAYTNLGAALLNLRKIEDALPVYEHARTLQPANIKALFNLGMAFAYVGRKDDSIAMLRHAVVVEPDHLQAHYNLGNVHYDMGRLDEARPCFERTLAIQLDFAPAWVNLGNVFLFQGMPEKAIGHFDEALRLRPDKAFTHSNKFMALNYLYPPPIAALREMSRRYGKLFETKFKPWPAHLNSRHPERRLRIGYVSADFRLHSVWFFMEPIMAHHRKREVEVYCYYNFNSRDAATERLQRYADHWIPCIDLSDDELDAQIRADGIDVLVDLSGHTCGNRLLVFARKPAPVQVTYLGCPTTTGLSAVDYRLVTADTDPPGAERWHSERLYRLPRSLWCYRPPANVPPAVAETPARHNGFTTFGSMNNITKLSDATVAVWSMLLKRLPEARLILTNMAEGTTRAQLVRRFAAHGIEAQRLIFYGKLSYEDYYTLLNRIDIALDPYPYNGTTTTCQCLWMGIPVVTLIGETSVARSGYALLKSIKLEELAARDEDEYLVMTESLARDLDRLDSLRAGMRARMAESALRDEEGLTRDLETAYRWMWREWCRSHV